MARGGAPAAVLRWTCARLCVLLCGGAVVVVVCAGQEGPGHSSVVYSSPVLNSSYRASSEFDQQGLEYLYYVTNMFLDAIQRNDTAALDQRQLEVARQAGNLTETLVHLGLHDWPTLVHHHLGYALLAGVGVVVAVLTPVVGLIICCCRCAGKCGGKVESYDKRRDTCRRWGNGLCLGLLVILVLLGAVASFVANASVESGVTEVPPRLHVAVDDSQLYVLNTKLEVNHLLKTNFMELSESLEASIEQCGVRVISQLATISGAVAAYDLTDITKRLADVKTDLSEIASKSRLLQNKADQLHVGLQDAHAELTVLLRSCGSTRCQQVAARYNLSQLVVDNRFQQLPDVTGLLREISDLLEADIQDEVGTGKRALDALSERIQAGAARIAPEIRRAINQTGVQLQEAAQNITEALDGVQLRPAHSAIKLGNEYLQQYGPFRYYVFVIISSLVTLITFCFVAGLFAGLCGRRPGSVYGDDTCDKGTGANFLISGTFFYFLFGCLLLLVVTCMFLLGGLAQFYFCDGLRNHATSGKGLAILQAVYPLQRLFPSLQSAGFDVTDVVRRCHRNESIYTVLNLSPLYDVAEVRRYRQQLGLDQHLEALRHQIQVDTDVEILTPRAKEQLRQLAGTDLAHFNYTAISAALEEQITSLDLRGLGQEVEEAGQELPADQRSIAIRMRNQAIILKAQKRVVDGMLKIVQDVKNSVAALRQHAMFNDTNVTEAAEALSKQAEAAQVYLNTRGRAEVTKLAEQFTGELVSRLDGYADHVEGSFRQSLGRCGPLSTVYNSTAVTLCSNVVYPFNAFWASIGWCLLLIIPCIVLSLVLIPLYRKSEPFSEGLMDTEYLYDAYGDHDNIPLSNVRERGGERRRQYDNHRSRGYSPEEPSYTAIPPRGQQLRPVGASRDITDTEPKAPPHWDMNAGPPGYLDSPRPGYVQPPPYCPVDTQEKHA